jgi:methionine synthase II (cobalamin-independent)
MSHDVYLVGSVPMANAEQVFQTVSAAFGAKLKRIPDGETGERADWITWLRPVFSEHPAFELSDEVFRLHATAPTFRRHRLRSGWSAGDVRIENLFYADIAAASYRTFKKLKDAGKIPPATRFQVDLVPAHSVIWLFLIDALHAPIDPIYNEALKREIDKIAAAIPHEDLAIQFDVASAVFARLQREDVSSYGRTKAEMQERFSAIVIELGNRVPADVELLYHLCYGDSNHRHVVEPKDMADMVDFTNRVLAGIKRPVNLVHMPVPRDRADDAYFAPLIDLRLRPETELCLGLVHYTDGVDGTARRLATARKYAPSFSIGTECGFGRRKPDTIPELLRIHAAVADMD